MMVDEIRALSGELGKKFMLASGAGAGATVMYLLWTLAQEEPKAFIEALTRLGESWGPTAIIAALIIIVFAKVGGQLIEVNKENGLAATATARAMQEMADGVKRIAEKDDERQRENELKLNFMISTGQRTRELLEEAATERNQNSELLNKIQTRLDLVGVKANAIGQTAS
jgi:hypothetical protein